MAKTQGFRFWPFVSFSFALIVALVALFAWSLSNKAFKIDEQASMAHRQYQRADDAITNIRADVYRAALLSHDLPFEQRPAWLQKQLSSIRTASELETVHLENLLGRSQRGSVESLKRLLDSFWVSLSVPADKLDDFKSSSPDKRVELRDAVLNIAEQIDALNEASIQDQEAETSENRQALRRFALRSTVLLVALSLCVALASIYYLAGLERRSEQERQRLAEAEEELRHLSQQLVRTQEEERKNISRELHDEVGQILTGLRMELGTLSMHGDERVFSARIDSIKSLAEEALRSVRNLSLLLRPSMLDDLGLAPALRWQAKEFSRRLQIPITVDIQGDFKELPEPHRICLYRVVQEALTNSTRHAEASFVAISLVQNVHSIEAVIRDDGKGFEPQKRSRGLGLVGMEERVKALKGTLAIHSSTGKGTELRATLPLEA
jgi:signal transduction histidine kinase